MLTCSVCKNNILASEAGEPYLQFKNILLCSECYISIIPEIYFMAEAGDGGLIHLLFMESLKSSHNRKRRVQLKDYKKTLKRLLSKYKFQCVICGSGDNLTIDHIKPVSKGGTDKIENLQILCKSCNSKKGAKWIETEKGQNLP